MSAHTTSEEPPDHEPALIVASRAGDRAAFGQLVLLHQRGVRVCVALRMHDPHEAEDLAQEAFVIAWRRLRDFAPEARFGPWVRGIAINLVRNHWRKHRAQPVGGSGELDALIAAQQDDRGGNDDAHHGTLAALGACLGRLDQPDRQLVRLRYEDAVSIEELSARLNARPSTLTMRLHRLRAALRSCIERQLAVSS
jgi:RNA polymerase sigma-70 factor (ECF subfamily)